MLSAIRPRNERSEAVSNWALIGQQSLQNQAIGAINATRMEQQTLALGARWDFHAQAALKMQWSSTRVKPYGYALWWRDARLDQGTSRVDMFALSLDFMF